MHVTKKEKTVLITGGATGIGKAMALTFAKKNFHVIINYHISGKKAKKLVARIHHMGRKAYAVQADVGSESGVARMFQEIKGVTGHVDVLINNAGWTEFVAPEKLQSITPLMYERIMDVNFKSVFLCSRYAQKFLEKATAPLIINVASVSGFDGKGSNIIYCAAKAAVICLTKSLADALKPHIRVSAIAPGYVQTDFIRSVPQAVIEQARKKTLTGKLVTTQEIADAAIALFEAEKQINGQTLVIDGKSKQRII